MSSWGLGPAKTSVFVGGCRPQDPGHESPVRQHRQPFVIAMEHRDRGDPVNNKVARMRAGINYWIASLRRAMTKRM